MPVRVEKKGNPPSCRDVLGIRFVLLRSERPLVYLADTLVTETQWNAIEANVVTAVARLPVDANAVAKVAVSVPQVRSFVEHAAALVRPYVLRLPSTAELTDASRDVTIPPSREKKLYSIGPFDSGAYDLVGVLWQVCRDSDGFWAFGGSCHTLHTSFADGPPRRGIGPYFEGCSDLGARLVLEVR